MFYLLLLVIIFNIFYLWCCTAVYCLVLCLHFCRLCGVTVFICFVLSSLSHLLIIGSQLIFCLWKQSGKSGGTHSPMAVWEVKVFTGLQAYLVLWTKAPILFYMQFKLATETCLMSTKNLDLEEHIVVWLWFLVDS